MLNFHHPGFWLICLCFYFLFYATGCTSSKRLSGMNLESDNVIQIPYNNHGVWGYADTLGNVTIKPQFLSTDFFWEMNMGDKKKVVANITTKYGENYISPTGKFIFPEKMHVHSSITLPDSVSKELLFVVSLKNKFGVYGLDRGMYVPAAYDSISTRAISYNFILLKNTGDDAYDQYLPETDEVISTDITSVEGGFFKNGYKDFARKEDGTVYRLRIGEMEVWNDFPEKNYTPDSQLALYDPSDEVSPPRVRKSAEALQVDKILTSHTWSNTDLINKYEVSVIYVAEKNGKAGIVDENGMVILPFNYDQVTLEYYGHYARLIRGDKVGYKLFASPYPAIEPKYDNVISVRNQMSFTLMLIEVNGQQGFVGENGVEYFDLR